MQTIFQLDSRFKKKGRYICKYKIRNYQQIMKWYDPKYNKKKIIKDQGVYLDKIVVWHLYRKIITMQTNPVLLNILCG